MCKKGQLELEATLYPTFVCKVPRDQLGFVFSLDGFKVEFFEFVEIRIVFPIIRDSDLLVGGSEVPGEFSSEGINFLTLPLSVDSFVDEGVVGVEMVDGDVMFFFFCEGSSMGFPTHSLVVSWKSSDNPTTFVPLIMNFVGWLQDWAVWGMVVYLSSSPTVLLKDA